MINTSFFPFLALPPKSINDTVAEWLLRCTANAFSFGYAGSIPVGVFHLFFFVFSTTTPAMETENIRTHIIIMFRFIPPGIPPP